MDTTKNKTGTFGDKGQYTYNIDAQGNPFGAPITIPKNINTVGADQINNSSNITTPDIITPSPTPGLDASINGAVTFSKNQTAADIERQKREDEVATKEKDVTTKFNELLGVNTSLGAVESTVDRTAENEARKNVDRYTSEIEQMQKSSRDRIEKFKKTFGGTTEGANIEAARMEREDLSAQADKALLLSAATREYSTLNSIAEQQVKNNTSVLQAKSDNLKAWIEMNKDDLDKKEKRLYDEEQKRIDAELKKKTDNEEAIKEIKLAAAKGGANSSIIAKLSSINTDDKKSFDDALKIATPYLGDNSIVKLDNGNTIMVNSQGKQIASFGGAKASETSNYAFSNDLIKNNYGNDLVSVIAGTIKNSGAKQSQSTNDAINVIAGLQALVKDNPDGSFVGLNPLIRVPNKLASQEALTNRSNIEAINLKVQQWASGAALTEEQTKKVEKMTPSVGDTDKQIRSKVNALANYMVSQVSGQLAGQGVGFSVDKVDMFTKSPEQELSELYKDPKMKTKIEEAAKAYPNYSDAEILQIIKG